MPKKPLYARVNSTNSVMQVGGMICLQAVTDDGRTVWVNFTLAKDPDRDWVSEPPNITDPDSPQTQIARMRETARLLADQADRWEQRLQKSAGRRDNRTYEQRLRDSGHL